MATPPLRADLADIFQRSSTPVDPTNDPAILAIRTVNMGYDPISNTEKRIQVNPDGSMKNGGQLVTKPFDTVTASYPSAAVEVYVYSLTGTTQNTVTVTYTDSTKASLSSVVLS